jgi:hypothetical protein
MVSDSKAVEDRRPRLLRQAVRSMSVARTSLHRLSICIRSSRLRDELNRDPLGWPARLPSRRLCRPHPQRREAGRPARHATDAIRVDYQSKDRDDARRDNSVVDPRPRRRDHRVANGSPEGDWLLSIRGKRPGRFGQKPRRGIVRRRRQRKRTAAVSRSLPLDHGPANGRNRAIRPVLIRAGMGWISG